jgi:hypothetical protein
MSLPGNSVGSLSDDSLGSFCSSSTHNRGVWYTVTSNFTRNITFATSAARFDHEIVVFFGDSCATAFCDGRLKVATNDTGASITFVAEPGTQYFILVTGYNGSSDAFDQVGTFGVTISGDGRAPTSAPTRSPTESPSKAPIIGLPDDPTLPNDKCVSAKNVTRTPFSDRINTTFATPDPYGAFCNAVDGERDYGVWYSFPGTDKVVNLTISSTTTLNPKIAVLTGPCSDLNCVADVAGKSLSWEGVLGMEYRILVSGPQAVTTFSIKVRS